MIHLGPFTISRKASGGNYYLKNDAGDELVRAVHVNKLKLAEAVDNHFQEDQSEDQVYEVEAILNHKEEADQLYYLVKWMGYNEEENSWVHETDILTSQCIGEYWLSLAGGNCSDHQSHLRTGASPYGIGKPELEE